MPFTIFFSFQTSQKHFVFIVYRNTHKGHGVLIFTLKMLMNILFMPHWYLTYSHLLWPLYFYLSTLPIVSCLT